MITKSDRVEDPAYLDWVRAQRCAPCVRSGRRQRFRTEAHHVGGKGMGGARLRDDIAMPACRECHMRCEGQIVDGRGPILLADQVAWADEYRTRYLAAKAAADGGGPVPW